MATHTKLKGSMDVGRSTMSDQIEANFSSFFQWSFLGAGGFFDVRKAAPGHYGGDQSQLRSVDDPNYPTGTVWEGYRKDWVWEKDVEYIRQPIAVSGVYVGANFIPIASGVSVDYPNGRITLANPIPRNSVVRAEFSYRLFQVYTADNPAWMQVQTDSFRVDDAQFLQQGSGAWDVLAQNRIQLPAVFVESVPRTTRIPKELGSGNHFVRQDVLFHILTDSTDRWHYKWLHDALVNQEAKRLCGYDKNSLLDADAFPLSEAGAPKAGALMYPDMVRPEGPYYWEQIRIVKTQSTEQPKVGGLNFCTVRATVEVDQP